MLKPRAGIIALFRHLCLNEHRQTLDEACGADLIAQTAFGGLPSQEFRGAVQSPQPIRGLPIGVCLAQLRQPLLALFAAIGENLQTSLKVLRERLRRCGRRSLSLLQTFFWRARRIRNRSPMNRTTNPTRLNRPVASWE